MSSMRGAVDGDDGSTEVRYCWLEERNGSVDAEIESLAYDYRALATAMQSERLPQEFIDTVIDGWWTTCLEILPARERALSRF